MKEFQSWISDMAGTIEDKSEFIKPCSCGASARTDGLNAPNWLGAYKTQMQRRLEGAMLIVGHPDTPERASAFIRALCLKLSPSNVIMSEYRLLDYHHDIFLNAAQEDLIDICANIVEDIVNGVI